MFLPRRRIDVAEVKVQNSAPRRVDDFVDQVVEGMDSGWCRPHRVLDPGPDFPVDPGMFHIDGAAYRLVADPTTTANHTGGEPSAATASALRARIHAKRREGFHSRRSSK